MKLGYPVLIGAVMLALRRQHDELLVLAFAMMIWTSLVLGLRMAPSIATMASSPRLPFLRECLAILVGLVIAYIGFGIVDEFLAIAFRLSAGSHRPVSRVDLISDLLLPLWLVFALLPAAAQFVRHRHGAAPSIKKLLAGMAASLPPGVAIFFVWQMVGKPFFTHGMDDAMIATMIILVPPAGFLLGLGGLFWWRALAGYDRGEAVETEFGSLMRLARLLWAIQVVVLVASITAMMLNAWRGTIIDSGRMLGGISLIVVAVAWIRSLSALQHFHPTGTLRAIIAALLLPLCFAASQLPPIWVMASGRTTLGDVGILAALFVLPVLGGTVFICLRWVPWVIRRIIGSP